MDRSTKVFVVFMNFIALFAILCFGFTYTLDNTDPDGSTRPVSYLDDSIRNHVKAIIERNDVDHYWPYTGTQVSASAAGEHRKVQFYGVLGSKPTLAAGEGALYIKTVSGVSELFYEDSAGTEKQLTTAGKLNLVSGDITTALNFSAGLTVGIDTDIGNYDLRAKSFTSDVAIGTAPLTVTSTTVVTNLNADTVDGKHMGAMFGAWTTTDTGAATLVYNSVYLAQCDGFVVYYMSSTNAFVLSGLTDGSSPPTTIAAYYTNETNNNAYGSILVPVRSGDYVKVTRTGTPATAGMRWLPLGTGGLVLQP